jgi:hypothetical protein
LPFPAIFGNTGLQLPYRNPGMEFSTHISFPKIGKVIFHSHSRSRKSGMEFSTCIPVCENWEWNFPLTFPFPKFENGICHSRSSSQSPKVIPTHPLVWPHRPKILFPSVWGKFICKEENQIFLKIAWIKIHLHLNK